MLIYVICRDIWKLLIMMDTAEVLTNYPIYTQSTFVCVYDKEVWGCAFHFWL